MLGPCLCVVLLLRIRVYYNAELQNNIVLVWDKTEEDTDKALEYTDYSKASFTV